MASSRHQMAGRHRTTSHDGGLRTMRYFRASDAEWKFIRELAEDNGMSASELIRSCVLDEMPKSNPALKEDEK